MKDKLTYSWMEWVAWSLMPGFSQADLPSCQYAEPWLRNTFQLRRHHKQHRGTLYPYLACDKQEIPPGFLYKTDYHHRLEIVLWLEIEQTEQTIAVVILTYKRKTRHITFFMNYESLVAFAVQVPSFSLLWFVTNTYIGRSDHVPTLSHSGLTTSHHLIRTYIYTLIERRF